MTYDPFNRSPYYFHDEAVRTILGPDIQEAAASSSRVRFFVDTEVIDIEEASGVLAHQPTGRRLIVVEGPAERLAPMMEALARLPETE